MTCKFLKPINGSPCAHYLRSDTKGQAGLCSLPNEFLCIEAMMQLSLPLTQSAAKMFMQCPEKYKLAYINGYRIRKEYQPDAIKAGTVWDSFMNAQYHGRDWHIMEHSEEHQLSSDLTSKLLAMTKAYIDLEIKLDNSEVTTQAKVQGLVLNQPVHGYVDALRSNSFDENKCSSNPDFYSHKENINFQLGTYFMLEPSLEFCNMQVVRLPGLKRGKDEESDTFLDRVYSDIIGRPGYYFIGFNRKDGRFGKRYWRSEFDLDYIRSSYVILSKLIKQFSQEDLWYKNELSCLVPAPCPYLDIKRSGVVSDKLYTIEKGEIR